MLIEEPNPAHRRPSAEPARPCGGIVCKRRRMTTRCLCQCSCVVTAVSCIYCNIVRWPKLCLVRAHVPGCYRCFLLCFALALLYPVF